MKGGQSLATQRQWHKLIDIEMLESDLVGIQGWMGDDLFAIDRYIEIGETGKAQEIPIF